MRKLYEREFEVYAQPITDPNYFDPDKKSFNMSKNRDKAEFVGVARSPRDAQQMVQDFKKRNPDYDVWYEMKNRYTIPLQEDLEINDIVLEKGDKIILLTEMEEEYMYMDYDDIDPALQDFFARKLASEWYDGMGDPLYALTSSGAILRGVEDSIMNQVGEPQARDFLMSYIDDKGYRGPQSNYWKYIKW